MNPAPRPSRRLPKPVTVALALLVAAATACSAPPAPEVPAHARATHADARFTDTFRHEFADVDGVRMHYVTGGRGTPVVLLHGWPQTWYC